jgi:hypothetical protein
MPSTIGISTAVGAVHDPCQRKGFYANGLFWEFYSNGTYLVCRTSTDGITWSAEITIRASTDGSDTSIWFDGTYFHYAWGGGATNVALMYRRGLPNSDGTITWSADEQIAVAAAVGIYYKFPSICVDSTGHPWIMYRTLSGTTKCANVTTASTTDGTWTTASGFPYTLSSIDGYWKVLIVPLTNSKVLALYTVSLGVIRARAWSGSAWGTEVTTTSSENGGYYWSAVAEGDNVHLVFPQATTYNLLHTLYTYTSNSFGTETQIQAATTSTTSVVISIDISTNNLYCFWAGSPTANHIYYKKCVSGTWDTDPTDWITETETLTGNYKLSCFYKVYGGYIGLLYMTLTASPYNVKFAYLTIAAGGVTYPVSISESSISVSDSPAYNVRRVAAVSESLGSPSDAVVRVLWGYRTVSEPSISVGDAITVVLFKSVSVSESLGAPSDSIAYNVRRVVSISESSISMSDSLTYTLRRDKAVSESISVSDGTTRVLWAYRTLSEPSISASDSVARGLFLSRSISETSITFSDSTVQLLYRSKAVSEPSVSVSDTVSAQKWVPISERSVSEPTISVLDSPTYMMIRGRMVSEPGIPFKLELVMGNVAVDLKTGKVGFLVS